MPGRTFTLAASVAGLTVVKLRERVVAVVGALTAGCGIILPALGDAHGSAVIGGLVIGMLVGAISPPGIISASVSRAGMPGELHSSDASKDVEGLGAAARGRGVAPPGGPPEAGLG